MIYIQLSNDIPVYGSNNVKSQIENTTLEIDWGYKYE